MQTCETLKARQWFKFREPKNWAIILGCFIPAVWVFQHFINPFLVDVIAIAVATCIFFLFLHKRAIGIECPSCEKYILTNTPWICGFCGAKNFRVDDFPFVGRCGNKECGAEPKAYQCHHCDKLIFLTPDRQRFNFAKSVNIPDKSGPVRVKKDERAEVAARVQLKELKVKEAEFDVELKSLHQTLEGPKMKSIEELYRATIKNEDNARRLRAEIDEEFKNDEDERKRRHLVVDMIMREMS